MEPRDNIPPKKVQGGYKGAPPNPTNQGKPIVPPQGGSGTAPPKKDPPKK